MKTTGKDLEKTGGDKPLDTVILGSKRKRKGRQIFYKEVDSDIAANGYFAIPGEGLTQGRGVNRYTKSGDGIAVKGSDVVTIEKCSDAEDSQSGKYLKNDYVKNTRADVDQRVASGKILKAVGLHETKLAQAEYHAHNYKKGITGIKDHRIDLSGKTVSPGYSVSKSRCGAVEEALKNRGISKYKKIEGTKGTVTYIWDMPPTPPS